MKKFTTLFILIIVFAGSSQAKKDIDAWKKESTLDEQYKVFKENLNFWNGSFFMKPEQLSDFYGSLTDTISELENSLNGRQNDISGLENEINAQKRLNAEIQAKLEESIKHQNSIKVLGTNINKNVYSVSMYLFIAGVLVLAGIVFVLFKRSNQVTVKTKRDYEELKQEFEAHKKSALDRYTKINMELHQTRLELKKK